jgi:Flp pilus assembly protein TadB
MLPDVSPRIAFGSVMVVAFTLRKALAATERFRWARLLAPSNASPEPRHGLWAIVQWFTMKRRLNGRGADAELLELVSGISRLTRSGSSLHRSTVESIDRLPDGFLKRSGTTMLNEASRIGFFTACQRWSQEPRVQLVGWTLAILHQTGGDPSEALDAVAASLRLQHGLHREVRALTAQSTLSAAVMASVPIMFATLLTAGDPNARAFLFGHPIGQACAIVGVLLDVAAWRWLRRLGQVQW